MLTTLLLALLPLLPTPTGSRGVGTTVTYLTRGDRPIAVQAWYPTTAKTGRFAPYLIERGLVPVLRAGYYDADSATISDWSALRTHSRLDVIPQPGSHALVVLSTGQGVIRANYTTFAEDLASHGYVVVLVDAPLQGLLVLPGGKVVSDSTGVYGEPDGHRLGVNEWSRDISYVLDRLQRGDLSQLLRRIGQTVDWKRIAAVGHSTGGLVAVQTCERDVRLRACINMDGGIAGPEQKPMADFVTQGISKPVMFLRSQPLYDDTTFARRGITREQWEKRNEGGRLALEQFVARANGKVTVAFVAGTGHFSFTDAPFVLPTAITRFGGRIIEPTRGYQVITRVIRSYLEDVLDGRGSGLRGLSSVPELSLKQ